MLFFALFNYNAKMRSGGGLRQSLRVRNSVILC